jgi:hypothetical protein
MTTIVQMSNREFTEWLESVDPSARSLLVNKSMWNKIACCFQSSIQLQLADQEPLMFHSKKIGPFLLSHTGKSVDVSALDEEGLLNEFQELYIYKHPTAPVEVPVPMLQAPVVEAEVIPQAPLVVQVPVPTLAERAQAVEFPEVTLEHHKVALLNKDHKELLKSISRTRSPRKAREASRILLSKIMRHDMPEKKGFRDIAFLIEMNITHQTRGLAGRQKYIDTVDVLLKKARSR